MVMTVEIRVKDNKFVSYIETCLKFMGSGEYGYAESVFTLNVSPFHVWMPKIFICNTMVGEGYDPSQIFDYIVKE